MHAPFFSTTILILLLLYFSLPSSPTVISQLIISYLFVLGLNDNPEIAKLAWSYMNDGLRTNIFIRFSVEAIACACIHLSLLQLGIPMPDWCLFLGVPKAAMLEIWLVNLMKV